MDFGGVGTLLSLLQGFYKQFTKLGEDNKQLATDTEAIQKLAEDLKEFLQNNSDKFKAKHIVELQVILRECRTIICKAEVTVEELSGTWKRLKQTLKDGHIAELQRKVKRCLDKLVYANQGILRALIVGNQNRPNQQPQPFQPLSNGEIPPETPPFEETVLLTGQDINMRNSRGYTALYTACENGNDGLVKTLLNCGADPWLRTGTMKKTAMHVAAFNAHTDALKAIKNHVKPQHTAAPSREDELRKISRLQREQDDCEKWQDLAASMDRNWEMPLHYAAKSGAVDAVELLIRALKRPRPTNSFIDAQNSSGHSALHVAAPNGRKEVVEVLLGGGANPLLEDNERQKPRDLAGNEDCAKAIEDKIALKCRKGMGKGGKKGEVKPRAKKKEKGDVERKEQARDKMKKKGGMDEKAEDKEKIKFGGDKRRSPVRNRRGSQLKRRRSSGKKRKKE